MKHATLKRVMGILLAVTMLVGLIPLSVAADSRTVIDTVVGTFNGVDITPVYGAEMVESPITVTTGEPAYFSSSMYGWQKYNGTQFTYNYDETFSDGIYRYVAQVRVDDGSGLTHALSEDLKIIVDGQEWTVGSCNIYDEFSYAFTYSPEFTVEVPSDLPLTFHDSVELDIDKTIVGCALTPFSLAKYAAGGTKPYTFSKVSGPDWLTVSADGTVSGTPTAVGKNDDLVVKVTDKAGASQSVTIAVEQTVMDPNNRTVVDTVVGTFNGVELTPEYGEPLAEPAITVVTGEPAYFASSMYGWKKYDGTQFVYNYDETFSAGIYRYVAQIRIDGNSGLTHVLAEDLKIIVDGQEWTVGSHTGDDELSFVFVLSPEMTVWDPSVPRLSFDANGANGTMKNAVTESGTHTLPVCTFKHPSGTPFLAWNVNGVEYAPGDVIVITENTTAVAVWGEPIKFTNQPVGGSAGFGNGHGFTFETSLPITKATLEIKDPAKDLWISDGNAQMSLSSGTLSFPGEALCRNNKSVYRVKVTDGVQTVYSDSFTVTWVTGYAVSFAANGGTGNMDAANGIFGLYTLPECTYTAPEGKKFKAWSVDGVQYVPGDTLTVTADTTVAAVWLEVLVFTAQPTGATVGVGNGGKFTFETSLPITKATLEIKDPTKDLWIVDDDAQMSLSSGTVSFPGEALCRNNKSVYRVKVTDGVQTVYSDSFTVTWADGYIVSFRANGGTGEMEDVSGILGVYTLPECTFTAPDGMRFKNWMISRTMSRNPGESIVVTADMTITAVWEEISSEGLKGDVNGDGSISIADAMKAFYATNEKVTLTEDETDRADINGDGTVTIADAMKIFYYVSEKINEL